MATDTNTSLRHGILSDELSEERTQLIELLTKAYWMEIETVMSYIANSINPEGVRAQEIIESLEEDIQEELGHARQFGERIKELYGVVPGLARLPGRAVLPAAARRPDRRRPRDQGRDRGRDRRDRALQPDHRVLRGQDPVTQDMVTRSSTTRRATGGCSRASCASTRARGWPKVRGSGHVTVGLQGGAGACAARGRVGSARCLCGSRARRPPRGTTGPRCLHRHHSVAERMGASAATAAEDLVPLGRRVRARGRGVRERVQVVDPLRGPAAPGRPRRLDTNVFRRTPIR